MDKLLFILLLVAFLFIDLSFINISAGNIAFAGNDDALVRKMEQNRARMENDPMRKYKEEEADRKVREEMLSNRKETKFEKDIRHILKNKLMGHSIKNCEIDLDFYDRFGADNYSKYLELMEDNMEAGCCEERNSAAIQNTNKLQKFLKMCREEPKAKKQVSAEAYERYKEALALKKKYGCCEKSIYDED